MVTNVVGMTNKWIGWSPPIVNTAKPLITYFLLSIRCQGQSSSSKYLIVKIESWPKSLHAKLLAMLFFFEPDRICSHQSKEGWQAPNFNVYLDWRIAMRIYEAMSISLMRYTRHIFALWDVVFQLGTLPSPKERELSAADYPSEGRKLKSPPQKNKQRYLQSTIPSERTMIFSW